MSDKRSVAVVGAGLGGLCAGAKLLEAGFEDLTILEKAASVGGTWRDNTYPGCCCDVPVSLYQFSFAPSLAWSHVYPRHDEIRRYAEDVADRFGLRPHLHLGEETTRAAWDDTRATWRIETNAGRTIEANALVAALDSGHVAGAALDVFAPEPIPAGHSILGRANVILAPHVASVSAAAVHRLRTAAAELAVAALRGGPLPTIVNGLSGPRDVSA